MPAGAGLRSRTRHMFARGFRNHGYIPLTTYLRTYKIGDYVDIKVNGAIHKVQAPNTAWAHGGCLHTAHASGLGSGSMGAS
jgi:ribosomal protein L21E